MYNPDAHHRHSIRIKEYDYSQEGMYFITICTKDRECILAKISNNMIVGAGPVSARENELRDVGASPVSAQKIELTKLGLMVKDIYLKLQHEFKNIKLHNYVIMPNHIHGIIEICYRADTGPAPTIGDVICSFKTRTINLCITGVKQGIYKPFNKSIWQRNYYEHIIRNEKEDYKIYEYIEYNVLNWTKDKNFN